jgi:tetratricopeptide (TPR) repeat protein
MMSRRFGWLLTAACTLVVTQRALADDLEQARATYTSAESYLKEGRYQEARDAFEAVFKVVDVPAVAFKTAQANEKLGKLVRASELYALATELKPNRLWANKQTQLDAQRSAKAALAALDGRIPTLQLQIQGDLDAIAELAVDDVRLSTAALATPQRLDPGDHTIRITTKDGRNLQEAVTLAERDRKTATLDIAQAIAPSNPAPAPPVVQPLPAPVVSPPSGHVATNKPQNSPSAKPSTQQWLGYASLGVGAAGLALGTTAGLIAWSKYSSIKDECGGSKSCTDAVYDQRIPAYDGWRNVSTVGFIVAGVGAAAGVTLLVLHPRTSASARASVTVAPGALTLKGAF